MRKALLAAILLAACRGGLDGPPVDKNTAVTPETHTFFPVLTGPHGGIDCNTCHGAFDSFQGFDCLSCHPRSQVDPIHVGVPNFAWTSQQCRACHPDGTRIVDHALMFPIADGTTHAGIACNTCHVDPGNRKVFDCLSCHTQATTNPWHPGVPGYAWTSPKCYECHPQSNVPDFPHPSFPIDAAAAHADTRCGSCHVDQANIRAIDCVTCHPSATNAPRHSAVGGFTSQTPACLRCHGDSQVDDVLAHLPFRIAPSTARHYRESCVRCHPAYRTDKTFAASFTVYDCFTCHAGIHDGQYTSSVSCLRSGCHPDGSKP